MGVVDNRIQMITCERLCFGRRKGYTTYLGSAASLKILLLSLCTNLCVVTQIGQQFRKYAFLSIVEGDDKDIP